MPRLELILLHSASADGYNNAQITLRPPPNSASERSRCYLGQRADPSTPPIAMRLTAPQPRSQDRHHGTSATPSALPRDFVHGWNIWNRRGARSTDRMGV